ISWRDRENRRRGYLVLNQSVGFDAVRLRVFDLPLRERYAHEVDLPGAELPGMTWFRPYHDPAKIVTLSETGVLGLFGIRQTPSPDPALFPLLQGGGLKLASLLEGGDRRERSQVAQV